MFSLESMFSSEDAAAVGVSSAEAAERARPGSGFSDCSIPFDAGAASAPAGVGDELDASCAGDDGAVLAGGEGALAFVAASTWCISSGLSKCSTPLKISLHAPQRTNPARSFSWSCATRKVVWQWGHRVAKAISYFAVADAAGIRPAKAIQPSRSAQTCKSMNGA